MIDSSNLSRRDFVKSIILGAIGGTSLVNSFRLSSLTRSPLSTKKGEGIGLARPNIITIILDDQIISSFDLMPVVKSQLVDKGITFTNSFCSSPLCAPSRASILTGQYLHNHGEMTNSSGNFVNKRDKENTIATILKAGGYKTIFIGKYSHGYDNASYIPPGWDEWYALLGGSPGYYDYRMSDNGKLFSYGKKPGDYSTDVLARKVYDFIKRQKDSVQPFFMYLAPFAPHYPMTPSPRHLNKLSRLKFVSPLLEEDISDKPRWVQDNRKRQLHSGLLGKDRLERMSMENVVKLESLLAVDEMLNKMIKMLTKTREIDNTFIFFMADNGDDFSRHLYARGKLFPYEEGIRTVIIVRGPGVQAATRREHLVSTVDLLPTMAQIARIAIPGFADGCSLVPILSCDPLLLSGWRKACLVELGQVTQWPTLSPPPAYKVLRMPGIKYIEYENGEKEFYDLRLDPEELLNIYSELKLNQKKILHSQLQRLQNCSGSDCRKVENRDISIYFSV